MGMAETERPRWRNLLAIAATYLYIGLVVWGALEYFRWREGQVPWWTDVPIGFLAIAMIGPAQHRLLLLGQEAALGRLCRNRLLNELVGDWLIHFPFATATHHVRQQVYAHYQFPNDPRRDAETIIARRAGFWPLRWGRLLRLSAFIKWQSLRTNYNFEYNLNKPYFDAAQPPSKTALHVGTVYVLSTFAVLLSLFFFRKSIGDDLVESILTWGPPTLWLVAMAVFASLPHSKYHRGTLPGVYSSKTMTLMRITFISLVNASLGWITFLTERSAVLNYVALWMGPMFTTTAACYLIRHWRQHGNLEPGQIAHDRTPGLMGRLLLFPFGQERHVEMHHRISQQIARTTTPDER